ncbi:MAG TPA: pilus assembly protein TadG-related protein [Bryobacteraceae bacterium]|nr:pilus assembly protein TadG-related protein [Bryobacteraceae bacterium]
MPAGSCPRRGQALLLTVLSMPVVFGTLGLAIDLGWGYSLQRMTQSAADSAALGAASKALQDLGQNATAQCGQNVQCQALGPCPSSGNLSSGCLYARQNGVTQSGMNGRQSLQVAAQAGAGLDGSNVPGLSYWVQAVASQQSPQLFSAVLGNRNLNVTAKATAAMFPVSVNASMYLLNRSSDCFVSALQIGVVCGEDFLSAIGAKVNAPGGIYMSSSNSSSTPLPNVAAATILGSAQVSAPFTDIMGPGGINALGISAWSASPKNGFQDGEGFRDPMRGKGQPPAPAGLPDVPVPGGVITGNLLGGTKLLAPGNYYATLPGLGTPSGLPITIAGSVTFSDGASNPCGGFCNYVFYGGLVTASLSSVTFSPGRYVFAGAQPVSGGPGIGLTAGVNSKLQDGTPLDGGTITQNTDAGEIFIFTDTNYSGLKLPQAIQNSGLSFPQVTAGVQGGLGYTATLHGLNASSANLPAELKPFAPVLFWQDQANTTLKYSSNGALDLSCGSVCANVLQIPGSQQMILEASQSGGKAGVNFLGTIYAPRGAWITVLGLLPGDTIAGPAQFIAGALQMAINTQLDLKPLPNPMNRMAVSLIQ